MRKAGAEPRLRARPAIGARIARLWRGQVPILAWGDTIYWPGVLTDASGPWTHRAMAMLQHELQHILEYATGDLSPLRYGLNSRHWTYDYALGPQSKWSDFGAEQRASIVEHLWLIEHGLRGDPARGAHHRRVIPWAPSSSPDLIGRPRRRLGS